MLRAFVETVRQLNAKAKAVGALACVTDLTPVRKIRSNPYAKRFDDACSNCRIRGNKSRRYASAKFKFSIASSISAVFL
jgi:hypothetical protein